MAAYASLCPLMVSLSNHRSGQGLFQFQNQHDLCASFDRSDFIETLDFQSELRASGLDNVSPTFNVLPVTAV